MYDEKLFKYWKESQIAFDKATTTGTIDDVIEYEKLDEKFQNYKRKQAVDNKTLLPVVVSKYQAPY